MKKTLALCTPIPEKMMEFIQNVCDVTICGMEREMSQKK